MVKLYLELDEPHLWALAQLVKRIRWSHCRELSVNQQETQRMIDAVVELQQALAEVGYAPR